MKKALITGITGQDGAYLAELLLHKDYEVHGIQRPSSIVNTRRLAHLTRLGDANNKRLILHYGDLTDAGNLTGIVDAVQPDEIYNLAAQSHVQVSFLSPEYTANTDALGTLRLLEAIRILGLAGKTKFYQASTSELYGKVQEIPQRETTPFYPRSPYGIAKLYAYWITVNYREGYNIFACNGILFNHESPLRGDTFVTRKITKGVARIKLGLQDTLYLGNLNARRDWGFAGDYVQAMWRMLQQEQAEDYVIATGRAYTVREFVELAFKHAGISLIWQGEGLAEQGVDAASGQVVVKVDPRYFRPTEVDFLVGDITKAREKLGWEPQMTFPELVRIMVLADLEQAAQSYGDKNIDPSLSLCRRATYNVVEFPLNTLYILTHKRRICMPTLKDIERVFECEVNVTATPPFTTSLPNGGTVTLCSVVVPTRRAGYLVRAVVNWSATFAPIINLLSLTRTGVAQATFELLKDGGPIARVTQTIGQEGAGIGVIFDTATTSFDSTPIQVLDTSSILGVTNPITIFELRVTAIILSPPLNILGTVSVPLGSVTAAAGLVSLVVEEIDACRAECRNV